jgi:hypothetical protein
MPIVGFSNSSCRLAPWVKLAVCLHKKKPGVLPGLSWFWRMKIDSYQK